jgi:DNA-binding protein HU-beta
MNKTELVAKVAEATGETKAAAQKSVEAVLETVAAELGAGGKVDILGFGNFTTSVKAARTGRNPATGAAQDFPAKTVIKFKPGKALNERLPKA